MSRSQYEALLDIEQQNRELREQLSTYTAEVNLLTDHLEHCQHENEFLSQVGSSAKLLSHANMAPSQSYHNML